MNIYLAAAFGLFALGACTANGPAKPANPVTSFEACVAAGGPVMESFPRQCVFDGQTFVEDIETVQTDGAIVETFEIGPELLPCQGAFPQQCMIVNGEYFYDSIEGFDHVRGKTTVAEVERAQRCDPSVLNSCPQDVGIYTYRLVRVISQR